MKSIISKISKSRILILLGILFCLNTAFSQDDSIDIRMHKITLIKDDNARIDTIFKYFELSAESDPILDMKINQRFLLHSQKYKDKIAEAIALSGLGYDYRSFGNTAKSLEYNLKALALAQETENEKLIAYLKIGLAHNYKEQAFYNRAVNLYLSVVETGKKINDFKMQVWASQSLGQVYNEMNVLDTALIYAQNGYELSVQNNYHYNLSYTFINLGSIHGKLGNSTLAVSYFNMAIAEGNKAKSSKQLGWAYTRLAEYYYGLNQNDSSIYYGVKAIDAVQNTAFSNYSIRPAKLLVDIYEKTNTEKALKYFKIYKAANDSVFNARTIQQTQLMTFEDDMRQKELALEKQKEEEQQLEYFKFALIAIGILAVIILLAILNRTVITNIKVIHFLSVMVLLIVFEFINLVLHSFLLTITHHRPVLMLLALVCIAALIIPLHEKVEKLATARLVEKNKQARLAKAKKTIEELDENDKDL